jgi:hypothetical protein
MDFNTRISVTKMKPIMRSKTMWFSLLLVIVGAISDNLPALQAFISPQVYGYTLISVGIVCAILRFLTTQPLEDK